MANPETSPEKKLPCKRYQCKLVPVLFPKSLLKRNPKIRAETTAISKDSSSMARSWVAGDGGTVGGGQLKLQVGREKGMEVEADGGVTSDAGSRW